MMSQTTFCAVRSPRRINMNASTAPRRIVSNETPFSLIRVGSNPTTSDQCGPRLVRFHREAAGKLVLSESGERQLNDWQFNLFVESQGGVKYVSPEVNDEVMQDKQKETDTGSYATRVIPPFGIYSVWEHSPNPLRLTGHMWRLEKGFKLPPALVLVQNAAYKGDVDDWLWIPSRRMTLEEFQNELLRCEVLQDEASYCAGWSYAEKRVDTSGLRVTTNKQLPMQAAFAANHIYPSVRAYAQTLLEANENDSTARYDNNDIARILRFFDRLAAGDVNAYRAVGLLPPTPTSTVGVPPTVDTASGSLDLPARVSTIADDKSTSFSLAAAPSLTPGRIAVKHTQAELYKFACDAISFTVDKLYAEAAVQGDDPDTLMEAAKYLRARDCMRIA